ncbi:MAG: protein-L-isoaspartate(D-aspartate) O-methyltransferase [Methanosarcinales archaeon]|nr:MAG: protein-L-isoaspartate(D-aspartate) O-methyltransferase [Methanosarcinales archaeon]
MHHKTRVDSFEPIRARLVNSLQGRIDTHISKQVLQAMMQVPRHLFVRESDASHAYEDYPLSIGHKQTISAPHMVAIMCTLLDVQKGMNILEIGAGSGYHSAILAELTGPTGKVYSVERIPELLKFARNNLHNTGYHNVIITTGDGTLGLPKHAPYDRITVACAAPTIPPPLIEQLKQGGKMVIPIGESVQDLYLVHKNDTISKEKSGGVVFVPLIGEHGF